MRTLVAAVLLLAVSVARAHAQGTPRMPVHLVDRGGSTPTPGPDPSGVYSGSVTFTFANQGSFTQTWRVPIKSQVCSTCPAGQYLMSGTDYSLVAYAEGGVDRGSVSGVVNGDGSGFLELHGTNCSYISFGLGGASSYVSGRGGPSPGADLRVLNGSMTGRLSGYDCFGNLVTADLSLQKETTQPRLCPYFGGIYLGSYANSCGGSQTGDVILTQAGCAISGYSAGAATAIQGIITSSTTATFDFESTIGCGTGSGTAQISNGVITGTYSGTSNGGSGCCQPGPFSGTFTFTP